MYDKMNNILFLSQSELWTMGQNKGAPSLWLPIKGYLEAGYKVYFVVNTRKKEGFNNKPNHLNLYTFKYGTILLEKLVNTKYIGQFARILRWLYSQIRVLIIAKRILKKVQVSIIIINGPTLVPVAKLISLWKKIPIVVKYRGTLQLMYTNRPFYFLKNWIKIVAMKIPVSLVIMTNDGDQGDKVLEMHGVKKSGYKFWVNGVESLNPNIQIEEELRQKYLNKRVILMASQLTWDKGVHQMIKAMPKVIEKNRNVVLIIAGKGKQENELKEMVKHLELLEYVEFLGAIDYDKLKVYYKLADIFVSLYIYSNIGNPVLEAMAWGKCVVTLDHFDTNKFIINEKTGILLEDNQIGELPAVINELLFDTKRRMILGTNAREFACKNLWTWEERVAAEVREIERLIAAN